MKKRFWRLAAGALFLPVILLLVTGAGVYGALQTDAGRTFLTDQVEAAVSSPDGLGLDITRLEGNVFGDFQIAEIELTDPRGIWLTLQNVTISWSPSALFKGTARINEISAGAVNVFRQPELPAGEESESGDVPLSLPLHLSLAKFYIEQLDLKEAVLRRQGLLRVSMSANSKSEVTLRSELSVTPLDGQGGFIKGDVVYSLDTKRLGVSAELDGPEGGLISRVLGLPDAPAVKGAIVGDGPLEDWQGQITFRAENLAIGDLLILTKGKQSMEIELAGGIRLSDQLALQIPMIEKERITLTSNLVFEQEQNNLTIKSVLVENNAFQAMLRGAVDLETFEMAGVLNANVKQMAAVNELITPASVGSLSANVEFSGDLNNATFETSVRLEEGILSGDTDAAPLTFKTLNTKAKTSLSLGNLRDIAFRVRTDLLGLEGLPEGVNDLIGPKVLAEAAGRYSTQVGLVGLDSLNLQSDHFKLQAEGELHPGKGSTNISINSVVGDLQKLVPSVTGTVAVASTFTSSDLSQSLQGRVDAKLTNYDIGNPELQKLLGSVVAVGADISVQDDMLLVDSQLPLETAQVDAHAEIPMSFETITAHVEASLPNLDKLSEFLGTDLGGAVLLSADANGTLSDPDVSGTIEANSVKHNGLSFGDMKTRFTANTVVSSLNGKIDGSLSDPRLGLQFGATYQLADGANLVVGDLDIRQQGNQVAGRAVIPLDGQPLTGNIKASISNFMSLALFSDVPLEGKVDAAATFGASSGEQMVQLDLTGQNISLGEAAPKLDNFELKLSAERAFTEPEFDMFLVATGISNQNMRLKDTHLEAAGNLERVGFNFNVESGMDLPFALSGKGDVSLAEERAQMSLQSMQGFVSNKRISLQNPLKMAQIDNEMRVEPFSLMVGSGQVTGDVSVLANRVNARLGVQNIPLDLLNLVNPDLPVSGTLNADATLEVTPDGSRGEMSAAMANVTLKGPDFETIPPLSSELKANLSDGRLSFDAGVSGLTATTVAASGFIPVEMTLAPFTAAVPDQAPVQMVLDMNSDLDQLWPLLGLDRHLLTGTLVAKGNVSGNLKSPQIQGDVQLNNGRYEEIELGTIIEQLQFNASVQDNENIAIAASGVDGGQGALDLKGTISLADVANPDINISAVLREMAVLRQDALSVTTDADLRVSGNLETLSLQGDIATKLIEVDIGGAVAPSVVEIPVTEVNFPEGRGTEEEASERAGSQKVSLAIAINMPRRVFIRGRGLDSEWAGNLSVSGTAAAPLIKGELNPVRGQFTFSGKEFVLQKGAIWLRGNADLDPELSLAAKYEGKNVTAIVSIEGTASNPKISFSSPDGLPQDEVLARVLFGKSASKLSALEALQLAQAVAEVSGTFGGGGGIAGFARQALGVDVLSAGVNEETGNAELSVGKYVTDNIYVGVAQGATAGSTSAQVEIELTPNISVESKTDQSTNSSVGIFWKWDY